MSQTLLDDLRHQVADRQVVVLVGAGMAVGATGGDPVASWTGLLEDGARRCEELSLRPLPPGWGDRIRQQLQTEDVEEFLLVAEAITARLGGRTHGEYGRWLRESVGRLQPRDPEALRLLAGLRVPIATTNYDNLLEEATGRPTVTWRDRARVERVLRGGEEGILHLHGHWRDPESVILGIRSYDDLLSDEHQQAMKQALATMRTLLFVGFGSGLADPNFHALRSWMKRVFKGSEYRHFRLCIESEVVQLQSEHDAEERIFVVPYGSSHDQLAPFLRSLHSTPPEPPVAHGSRASISRPAPTHDGITSELPTIWNVPFLRNPYFIGRDAILGALREDLTSSPSSPRPYVLTGLGGVGKTQTVVEYVYRNYSDYDVVWWVRSHDRASLQGDFAALASKIGLPEDSRQDVAVEAVRSWLERHQRWLLVLDNIDEFDGLLPDLLPRLGGGHIILTSRHQGDWRELAVVIPVPLLEPEDATAFLLARTAENDREAASHVATSLGYLPLALEQAGAYIAQTGVMTLSSYHDVFQQRGQELLQRGRPIGYERTVDTTWDLSMLTLRQRSPLAVDLLALTAFLSPSDIPWRVVATQAHELPPFLAAAASDPITLADMITELRRYSLIDVIGDGLFLHPLLQSVVRGHLSDVGQRVWAAAAVGLIRSSFPRWSQSMESWPACERLLSHAFAASEHAERLGVAREATGLVLNRTGRYLLARGQFRPAEPVLRRALATAEMAHGPDHPYVGLVCNNLGLVLLELDRLPSGCALLRRAVTIAEEAFGPYHPQVALSLNSLGRILRQSGDLLGARASLERAVAIYESLDGGSHRHLAFCFTNLGRTLRDLGDLPAAKVALERSLAILEATHGRDNALTATGLTYLSEISRDLGDLASARALLERALAISESAYGVGHPRVAISLRNLSLVLSDLGERDRAHEAWERALAINEAVYGPDHPTVIADRRPRS